MCFQDDSNTYNDAVNYCKDNDAVLATVPDQITWTVLLNLEYNNPFWIGLDDQAQEGR